MEGNHNRFPPRASLFYQSIRDPLRELPFLIGRAAGEHCGCTIGIRHPIFIREYPRKSVAYFASSYPAKKKLNSKRAVSSASEP